ncbi:MAG: outer membrane beta-barrel protein [Alphaproteobacteria bacterium]|nr:outer membrane beta-barrel protein [Alphaproteobacteria bacterium]MBN2779806.1 outer membrane beta-barrel protein [Alphaproteobacteria bacterium]
MKKLFILFLFISSTVVASGWRQWGEPQPPSGANYYVAIRGGIGQLSADMKNSIPSFSTTYCQYYNSSDETYTGNAGYGPCHAAPGDATQSEIINWDEYDVSTEQMKERTGFYGVAFGGYLPNHTGIRIELEWARHSDFDYRDDRIYVGYPYINPVEAPGDPDTGWILDTNLDEKVKASFKSTVSSSHILFNVYYDFFDGGRKIGEWTPYIGVGVGLAQNKTKFTLIDSRGELVHDSSPLESYFVNDRQETPGREISHENFAWGARLGLNYALSEHLSFDFGIKYSNLGLVEWGMDEKVSLLRSDELTVVDYFFGFRFDF